MKNEKDKKETKASFNKRANKKAKSPKKSAGSSGAKKKKTPKEEPYRGGAHFCSTMRVNRRLKISRNPYQSW